MPVTIEAIKVKDMQNQPATVYYEWTPTTGWNANPQCQVEGGLYITFWTVNSDAIPVSAYLTMEMNGSPFAGHPENPVTIQPNNGVGVEFTGVMPSQAISITCKASNINKVPLDAVTFVINPINQPPPTCDGDEDCGEGYVCDLITHTCVPASVPECDINHPCPTGYVCVLGKCVLIINQPNYLPLAGVATGIGIFGYYLLLMP